jgi:hypothetical protein
VKRAGFEGLECWHWGNGILKLRDGMLALTGNAEFEGRDIGLWEWDFGIKGMRCPGVE